MPAHSRYSTRDHVDCRFFPSLISYQFLDDAYNNHKHHMASMTRQLQDKKKVIDEVSHSINSGYGVRRGCKKQANEPMSHESLGVSAPATTSVDIGGVLVC